MAESYIDGTPFERCRHGEVPRFCDTCHQERRAAPSRAAILRSFARQLHQTDAWCAAAMARGDEEDVETASRACARVLQRAAVVVGLSYVSHANLVRELLEHVPFYTDEHLNDRGQWPEMIHFG